MGDAHEGRSKGQKNKDLEGRKERERARASTTAIWFICSIIPGTRKQSMNMESRFCSVLKSGPVVARICHTWLYCESMHGDRHTAELGSARTHASINGDSFSHRPGTQVYYCVTKHTDGVLVSDADATNTSYFKQRLGLGGPWIYRNKEMTGIRVCLCNYVKGFVSMYRNAIKGCSRKADRCLSFFWGQGRP